MEVLGDVGRTWIVPLHAVWPKIVGVTAWHDARGVFDGTVGVEVVASPWWIDEDCVCERSGEETEENEEY